MLNRIQFYKALQAAKPRMRAALSQRGGGIAADHRRQLQDLSHARTVEALRAAPHADWPGARPTPEVDAGEGFRVPFTHSWKSVQATQEWAQEQLREQPIVAVDGSQLESERGLSLSVGAVQIGFSYNDPLRRDWEENRELEIVLLTSGDAEADAQGLSGTVARTRFVKECQMIPRLAARASRPPVCFYDNTFVISFAQRLNGEERKEYVGAVEELLRTSRQDRFPLVAYVDTSYSRDLGHMLQSLGGPEPRDADARMLAELLPHWGDRTPFMQCARRDALSANQGADFFYADIGFLYMRTSPGNPPARIEMPMWVYEEGKLEKALTVVRAQCLLLNREYPYALSRADRMAVLTLQDRRAFYKGLQGFLYEEMEFKLRRPAKGRSKTASRARRRR